MGVACSRPKAAADALDPSTKSIAPDAITLQTDEVEQRQRELDATAKKRWTSTPVPSSRSPQLVDEHAAATLVQATLRGHRSRKSHARSKQLAQAFDLPPYPAGTPRPSWDAIVDADARALVEGAIATALAQASESLEPPYTPASRVPLHRSRVAGSQDCAIPRFSDRRSNGSHADDRPTLAQLRAMCAPPEPPCPDPMADADPNENPRLRSAATLTALLEERSVLVALRVRPLSVREATSVGCLACNGDGVTLHVRLDGLEPDTADTGSVPFLSPQTRAPRGTSQGDERAFQFDCVLEGATQLETYMRTGRPLLQKALAGFNGCLFAYGQTGSGKTHTMLGSAGAEGVIPLLLEVRLQNESEFGATHAAPPRSRPLRSAPPFPFPPVGALQLRRGACRSHLHQRLDLGPRDLPGESPRSRDRRRRGRCADHPRGP